VYSARSPPHYSLGREKIQNITGHETVDRLPILISGTGVDQLFTVPKLVSGTGESAASAVYETALSRGICDQIKCMSFDTTSANTGPRNGACILLQQKIEKDMLWLASSPYGHHAEGSSSSCAWAFNWDRDTNFQNIKKCLEDNQTDLKTAASDASVLNEVENITTDVIFVA
jgi:hypothetical protein